MSVEEARLEVERFTNHGIDAHDLAHSCSEGDELHGMALIEAGE